MSASCDPPSMQRPGHVVQSAGFFCEILPSFVEMGAPLPIKLTPEALKVCW